MKPAALLCLLALLAPNLAIGAEPVANKESGKPQKKVADRLKASYRKAIESKYGAPLVKFEVVDTAGEVRWLCRVEVPVLVYQHDCPG